MNDEIVTYQPDNAIRKGFFTLSLEIGKELVSNRWLTYQLFKRDFLTVYKQSLIGILWAFIIPFVSVGTFIILNNSGVFTIGAINVPYPIYAILGMAYWQLFSAGLIASAGSLVKAGSMIVKINLSKKALVLASTGQSLVAFLVQILVVFALCLYYRINPGPNLLLIPVFIIPILFMTLGLGFIVSLLNGVMRDIGNALSILMTFCMFLTPVLYEKPTTGLLVRITEYNPMYYLVSFPRNAILAGTYHEWKGYAVSCAGALVMFIICILIFHLTETRVSERV